MTTVYCICGKRHTVTDDGERKKCSCGAQVWSDGVRPWVRIEEDSLEERKAKGKRVLLRKPAGRRQ